MAIKRALILSLTILVVTTGAVAASFVSTLQAQGTWNRSELNDFIDGVKSLRKLNQSSARIFEVELTTETGWHSHPGAPSLLIVESGTMDLIEPARDGGCTTTPLVAGMVIWHPTSTHNLVQTSVAKPVFTVVYFPPSLTAPLLQGDPVNTCTPTGGGGEEDDDEEDDDD